MPWQTVIEEADKGPYAIIMAPPGEAGAAERRLTSSESRWETRTVAVIGGLSREEQGSSSGSAARSSSRKIDIDVLENRYLSCLAAPTTDPRRG